MAASSRGEDRKCELDHIIPTARPGALRARLTPDPQSENQVRVRAPGAV